MKIIERSVQEIGKSLLITLPKGWADSLKVKKGSTLKIMVSEAGQLFIAPEFTKDEKKACASIKYDENFRRKFFREYFSQNEKITITLEKPLELRERKELSLFLQRFMNAQIIEECREYILIKIFTIQELSIEECAKRMHFLSLSMMEEIQSNSKVQEIRDNMTKFYYMLIMQVRRFLAEGKYTEENQISLLKAMDLRMVAEKMQRIAENLICMKELKPEIKKLFKETEDYYEKSFRYFNNNEFEKALLLWKQGSAIIKRIEDRINYAQSKKDFKENANLTAIMNIARLSKEISMLVR